LRLSSADPIERLVERMEIHRTFQRRFTDAIAPM
jgi:hypothetical protein